MLYLHGYVCLGQVLKGPQHGLEPLVSDNRVSFTCLFLVQLNGLFHKQFRLRKTTL